MLHLSNKTNHPHVALILPPTLPAWMGHVNKHFSEDSIHKFG